MNHFPDLAAFPAFTQGSPGCRWRCSERLSKAQCQAAPAHALRADQQVGMAQLITPAWARRSFTAQSCPWICQVIEVFYHLVGEKNPVIAMEPKAKEESEKSQP